MNKTQAMQILMLNSDASFDDVKYAYRKLSLELHPDRNKNESDGRRFKNVLDAYHFLKSQSRLENSHYNDETIKKKSRTYRNTAKQSPPEEDWSKFTKDFEMDENFWRQYEKSFWEDYEVNAKKNSDKRDFENPFWDVKQKNVNPEPKKNYQNNQSKANHHKISVDVVESLCIGCCSCETIAPNVFTVDKLKMINPKSHAYNQYGASEEKIMDAAETCPTKAIQVDEKKSGRKIFPR